MSVEQLEKSVCRLAREAIDEVGQHLEKNHGGDRYGIMCADCGEKISKKFDEIVALTRVDAQYSQSAVYGIINPVVRDANATTIWLAVCHLCELGKTKYGI